MASIDRLSLLHMREVQGVTAPDMCMASSKFLVLKALGYVNPDQHLRDFINPTWAKRSDIKTIKTLRDCWGWTLGVYNDDFNRKVLPAVLGSTDNFAELRYDYFRGQPAVADSLLKRGVPLVVAVGIGGPGQDHHLAVVPGTDGKVWAVDPYSGDASESIKALPPDFTFTAKKPAVLDLVLRDLHIPCHSKLVGYYRDSDDESSYVPTVGRTYQ